MAKVDFMGEPIEVKLILYEKTLGLGI